MFPPLLDASEHRFFFENRLYIYPENQVGNGKSFFENKGKVIKGAGSRSYWKITGVFLSFIGFASKLRVNNGIFYVNNKSFSALITRLEKKTDAQKMQNLYLKHKESPNENTNRVNEKLKEIVRKNGEITADDVIELIATSLRKTLLEKCVPPVSLREI